MRDRFMRPWLVALVVAAGCGAGPAATGLSATEKVVQPAATPGADPQDTPTSHQATVQGRVSDAGLTTPRPGFGGAGTVARAHAVVALQLKVGAAATVLGQTGINPDGSFALTLPAGIENVVLQAVDGNGAVLASGLLTTSGAEGATTLAPPVDTRSSIVAQVALQIAARAQVTFVDTIALRLALEAALVDGVKLDLVADVDVVVKLALALEAAQEARVQALVKAGVQVDAHALFVAELVVAAELEAKLAAGVIIDATVVADLLVKLDAAHAQLGISPDVQAWAEIAASLAARAVAKVAVNAVLDIVLKGVVAIEAHVVVKAVLSLAAQLDVDANAAAALAAKLVVDINAAVDVNAALVVAKGSLDGLTNQVITTLVHLPVIGSLLAPLLNQVLQTVSGLVTAATHSLSQLLASVHLDVNADLKVVIKAVIDLVVDLQVKVKAQATILTLLAPAKADLTVKTIGLLSAGLQPIQ